MSRKRADGNSEPIAMPRVSGSHSTRKRARHATALPEVEAPASAAPGHTWSEDRSTSAGGNSSNNGDDDGANLAADTQRNFAPSSVLVLYADIVDDAERSRVANENRYRSLTSDAEWGKLISAQHPVAAELAGMIAGLQEIEKVAVKGLKRAMKDHALGPFVQRTTGLGLKTAARFLGLVGDPYMHPLKDRPRTVSELWAFCGLHVLNGDHRAIDTQRTSVASEVPAGQGRNDTHVHAAGRAPRRSKGIKVNWSTKAKTRAYLMAECCLKAKTSPYRAVYLARRAHTAVTHPDWTKGHSHADGLRIAMKAILRDLWIEAKGLHDGNSSGATR